ncbi:MAG TPA: M48 family metallopeptidase [Anaerolineaceae bacterium]|nr:M48 family metallopeptidase [Anaerolineaceae bacterium]
MTTYRYPSEQLILFGTVLLVLILALITGGISGCLIPLLILVMIILAYNMNASRQRALLQQGVLVSPQKTPRLAALVQDCQRRLRPGQLQVIVSPSRQLNAYTFGLSSPEVIVVYSAMLDVMDEDELRFVIGHEMGHVALGHVWLNTLLGGMAGVPVSIGSALLLTLAFRSWNRACEYSADRAGLLACGKPEKAISALVKLVAGNIGSPAELQQALQMIERQDESLSSILSETLSTHPMIIKRIEQIRVYVSTAAYQRLQSQVVQTDAGA